MFCMKAEACIFNSASHHETVSQPPTPSGRPDTGKTKKRRPEQRKYSLMKGHEMRPEIEEEHSDGEHVQNKFSWCSEQYFMTQ